MNKISSYTLLVFLILSMFLLKDNSYRKTHEKMADVHKHDQCRHHNLHNEKLKTRNQEKLPKYHIVVRALGEVDQTILEYATNIIKEFFEFDCSIGYPERISSDMYFNENSKELDADRCIGKLDNQTLKTVFLCDLPLKIQESELRGYAVRHGKTMLVTANYSFLRETLIHEIGHSLGLVHCSDLTCVMAVSNDEYDSGTFCNLCSAKIGFTPTKNPITPIPNNFEPDWY